MHDKNSIKSSYLHKWCDNAKKIGEKVNGGRISKYISNRYKLAKARDNWHDLTFKIKFSKYSKEKQQLVIYVKRIIL